MKRYTWMTALAVMVLGTTTAQAADTTTLAPTIATVETQTESSPLMSLQQDWARIQYSDVDKDSRVDQLTALRTKAQAYTATNPNAAEPLIWEAIITSTLAGAEGGMGALKKAKHARNLLEQALEINPGALEGSAYTSLGSLYYQVPGGPIGFGSKKKAEKNLTKALEINPNGIDPNFFYGDYLIKRKRYEQAIAVLEHGLKAVDRPGREVADAGRREEIKAAIEKAKSKL